MASGDNARVWWADVEKMLRKEWDSRLSWEEIIALRGRLQNKLDEVREKLGIRDVELWCPQDQAKHPMKPLLTVNALLYRLSILGLETKQQVKKRSSKWNYYRKKYGLDAIGGGMTEDAKKKKMKKAKTAKKTETVSPDPYLPIIEKQWEHILMMYKIFEEKKPIIEYRVDDGKIYSYPASDYIALLSERTREFARKQYEDAANSQRFMLFVKDTKNQKLRSYVLDIE